MIVKAIEIRDRNTFIAALVIRMVPANEAQRWLLGRVGFRDGNSVVLMRLDNQKAHSDPYDWSGDRTLSNVHAWLEMHFDEISDGAVVDVEYILGETPAPKLSEREDG